MQKQVSVGIKNIGLYFPENIITSNEIALKSGIPEEVIIEKFGIKQKHKSTPDENTSNMALKAARKTLVNFNPENLDLILYHGSEYKDYYLYNLAARVQYELGAVNAYAFEIHSLCSSGALSLKVARDMMSGDPDLENVLLITASKEEDFIDYQNLDSRFMFNFGEGAAGVLLKRNCQENIILGNHTITDGSFANDVAVYNIGSKHFNSTRQENLNISDCILDVADIDSMRERLNAVTERNFYRVIETSVEKSGYTSEDINYLALIHMKKSFLDGILDRYNLDSNGSFLLNNYGHCQSADAYIAVKKGVKMGRIKEGDLVVLVGAGTGYTWSATCVRWGEN